MYIKGLIYLCLVSNISALRKNVRIIGGQDADIADFPYLVSLRRISDKQHVCGGAIISPRCILTAAHCFNEIYVTLPNLIIYSSTSVLMDNMDARTYLPDQIFVHPGFEGMVNGLQYSHDIAVLRIQGSMEMNKYQQIIQLPVKNIHHGDIAIIAGWGYTSYPSKISSNRLQKIRMNVYDANRCRIMIPFNLQIDQFCGYRQHGIGTCIGDSGSPLVLNNQVIGVASISIPCAKGIPDVYTNVMSHIDFVTTVLNK